MRILLVEDDPDLARQLKGALADAGYAVDHAPDGEEAQFLGETEPYDAVILDLGLPKVDGVSVLERWRRGEVATPVLILTARGARVQSPGAGLVQYVGPVRGWGVILILRMSGGYHLVLAGLDRVSVEVGQTVAAGAPVGWMADQDASPSELYLEVREQGAPVDPARWIRKEAG